MAELDTSKINEILNYYGLKTNIEETKKWVKQYVAEALTGITTDLMTNVTYNELVSLRDNGKLKPGMLYRMTDYVTKVYSEDESISSAEHPFDLILTAINENTLDENGRVALHDGDEYFNECNVEAWEVKYSLDNNTTRFKYVTADIDIPGIKVLQIESVTVDTEYSNYVRYENGDDGEYIAWAYVNGTYVDAGDPISIYDPNINWNSFSLNNLVFTYGTPGVGDRYFTKINGVITEYQYGEINDYCDNLNPTHIDCDGKGYIYYMKDEWNNEASYDFKNILQKDEEYTFGDGETDYSLQGNVTGVYGNRILLSMDSDTKQQTINKVRIVNENSHSNLIKPSVQNSYIDFDIEECDIAMNNDGELVVFKTQDYISGIKNKPIEHDYTKDYLTFEAVNDDTEIIFKTYTDDPQYTKTIEVSKDKVNWESYTSSSEGVILPTLMAGEKLYLRGNNSTYSCFDENEGEYLPNFILPLDYCYVYGNVMSLIQSEGFSRLRELTEPYTFYSLFNDYGNGEYSSEYILSHPEHKLVLPAITLAESCYANMFDSCTKLTTAPELPATTLADSCYCYMFRGCTSLVTAPELPATTLAESCYANMFEGCSGLVTAPELPATELAEWCYQYMFYNCTALETAPELPATTLVNYCYYYMFAGTNVLPDCSHIDFTNESVVASGGLSGLFAETKVTDSDLMDILPISPETNHYWLPVTTLARACYYNMFAGCSILTTAPELPATDLASNCYSSMFYNCTSLTTAPELPATTLANYCYNSMFKNCTSLVAAPELPATTLASGCCYSMFEGCSSLTTAPELPATTLTESCYCRMFWACGSLTTVPELPAPIMVNNCYAAMFYNCFRLNYIKCLATDISASSCTINWVYLVQTNSGVFVKHPDMNSWTTGNNGIPNNWTVYNDGDTLPPTYTVTFVDYDGTILKTQTVYEGTSATAPNMSGRSYTQNGTTYTFGGWNIAFSNVHSDLTVIADYEDDDMGFSLFD